MKFLLYYNRYEPFFKRYKVENKFLRIFLKIINFQYLIFFLLNTIFEFYLKIITKNLVKKIVVRSLKKKIKYKLNYPEKTRINYELSIAIPCYSRTKNIPILLDKALEKLSNALEITNINYEVCIFDNCSEFSIKEIIKKYKHLKIKYERSDTFLQPNLSWFNAVKMTSGNYVHIHSCDDEVDTNFYINFENILKIQSAELIYVRAKILQDSKYSTATFNWIWNWPETQNCFYSPKLGWIKHPMPSSSWICKREFYENKGVTGKWIQGLDLDLAIRLSLFIKKAYFSYDSFLYYRNHNDSGNNLDNPKNIKEFCWNIFKIGSVFNHLDYKKSSTQINDIIYNYIKHYALLHSIFPRLRADTKESHSLHHRLIKFKYFNRYFKFIFRQVNKKVDYNDFRKKDIIDKKFLENKNKEVILPNILKFPIILSIFAEFNYLFKIIKKENYDEDRNLILFKIIFAYRQFKSKNQINKKIDHNFFELEIFDLIKIIIKHKNIKSYCEIGVDKGETLNKVKKIKIIDAIGVDPFRIADIKKSSDNFFKTNKRKFDLIFIDGLHEFDQVLRDFENSIQSTNEDGIILIDDCLPSSFNEQLIPRIQRKWTGDTWKLLFLINELDFEYIISNCQSGIGIVKVNKSKLKYIKDLDINRFKKLDFNYFCENYKKLNIKNYSETINFVKN